MENFVKLVQHEEILREKQSTQNSERIENDLKLPYLSRKNQTEIKKKK